MFLQGFSQYGSYGPLVLRLALGAIMFAHGAQKLFGWFGGGGLEGTTGFFSNIGIPLAGAMAVVVALVEFVGGILIFIGFLTRIAAILFAVVMVVAIFTVHFSNGFFLQNNGYEFTLALLAMSLALAVMGSGALSVERSMRRGGTHIHVEGVSIEETRMG